MRHLGDWISALAAGELPLTQAESARAHLVACQQCAGEYRAVLAARARLALAPDAPGDLTDRLLRMCPAAARASEPERILVAPTPTATMAHVRQRHRLFAVVASLAGAAALTVALVVSGTLPRVAALALDDVQAIATNARSALDTAHTPPVTLTPTDVVGLAWFTSVQGAYVGSLAVMGSEVLVVMQRGLLDTESLVNATESGDGYLLAGDQAVLVWQDGDWVVQLVGGLQADVLTAAEVFPHVEVGDGPLERVNRGLVSLFDVVAGR